MAVVPSFYEAMPTFKDFSDLFHPENFSAAPHDWWVVITDVKGSTQAIEEGRYRDVNTVGAASIASIGDAMGEELFPFVFGGDGGYAMAAKQLKAQMKEALAAPASA